MPIRYLIDNEHRCVIKVWMGAVTMEEWYAVERQIMEDPNLPRNYKLLIDARKAGEAKITEEEIKDIVGFYKDYAAKVNGTQVAAIAGPVFEKARVYEKYAQLIGMNVIVFTNLDTACMWLDLDREIVNACIRQLQE